MFQLVYESNKYLRAIVNCLYYYKNKVNLGYYNEIQETMINNLIGDIINLIIEKSDINKSYDFIVSLIRNSNLIDYKIIYDYVFQIYHLNIKVIDANEKVIYSTGSTSQLNIMIDNDLTYNIYI